MNDSFTSPDGFISVSFPDQVRSVRAPIPSITERFTPSAQFSDFQLGWLPSYPVPLHKIRPVYPNWIGTSFAADVLLGIAPLAWEPHYPTYWPAPRLHQTFYKFGFDPLSGAELRVAQLMAWDPKQKAPLITRPKTSRTQFAYTVPAAVVTTGTECVEMTNEQGAVPTFTGTAVTSPTFLNVGVTAPTLVGGDVC